MINGHALLGFVFGAIAMHIYHYLKVANYLEMIKDLDSQIKAKDERIIELEKIVRKQQS